MDRFYWNLMCWGRLGCFTKLPLFVLGIQSWDSKIPGSWVFFESHIPGIYRLPIPGLRDWKIVLAWWIKPSNEEFWRKLILTPDRHHVTYPWVHSTSVLSACVELQILGRPHPFGDNPNTVCDSFRQDCNFTRPTYETYNRESSECRWGSIYRW